MKLHTKTTILISVITVAVMLATVFLIGVRMVSLVQEDEQELARFQALSLAEQISLMPTPRNEGDLARAIAQARGARPRQQCGFGIILPSDSLSISLLRGAYLQNPLQKKP